MDAAFALAKNIAATRSESMPADVVEVTKRGILDVLGTILAASGIGAGCKEVVKLLTEYGGKGESTIIAFGTKVPLLTAASANGTMAHALDYDDTFDEAGMHLSISTVPAGLALAEHIGKVSGRDFIAAVALGNELICRLGLAATRGPEPYRFEWLLSSTLGGFGAAATSARLLGLDEEGIVNTFGLALHQASGTLEMALSTGGIIRGLYPGFTARAGVMSALMAKKGITGSANCFEGKVGLYNVYFHGNYDRASLTADLGTRFEAANVSFKPWPCVRATHGFIDAALDIVEQHDIRPENVDRVTVYVRGDVQENGCKPIEERRAPRTSMDAKFSIPFIVGVAIAHRAVTLGDFTAEGIKNSAALKVAARVFAEADPEPPPPNMWAGMSGIGKVEIRTKDRAKFLKRVDYALGSPRKPMTMAQAIQKFENCASFAARPLPASNVKRVIQMVMELEKTDNVCRVIELVS